MEAENSKVQEKIDAENTKIKDKIEMENNKIFDQLRANAAKTFEAKFKSGTGVETLFKDSTLPSRVSALEQ